MGDADAALSQEIYHVAIAELKSDIPSNRLNDDQAIEMATFEEIRGVDRRLGHVYDYPRLLRFAPEPAQPAFSRKIAPEPDLQWFLGLLE